MAKCLEHTGPPSAPVATLLEQAKTRWLRNTEVLDILTNHQAWGLHVSTSAPAFPKEGSLFLFDRRVCRFFRRDGHNWRKKVDGKIVRETHEKLKVGSVETLNCYYAHAEHPDSLQRRCYWSLKKEDDHIVLVHYLRIGNRSEAAVPEIAAEGSVVADSDYPSQLEASVKRDVANTKRTSCRKPVRVNDDPSFDGSSKSGTMRRSLQHGREGSRPGDDVLSPRDRGPPACSDSGGERTHDEREKASMMEQDPSSCPSQAGERHAERQVCEGHASGSPPSFASAVPADHGSGESAALPYHDNMQQPQQSPLQQTRGAHDGRWQSATLHDAGGRGAIDGGAAQRWVFDVLEYTPAWDDGEGGSTMMVVASAQSRLPPLPLFAMFGNVEVPLHAVGRDAFKCVIPRRHGAAQQVTWWVTCGSGRIISRPLIFEYRCVAAAAASQQTSRSMMAEQDRELQLELLQLLLEHDDGSLRAMVLSLLPPQHSHRGALHAATHTQSVFRVLSRLGHVELTTLLSMLLNRAMRHAMVAMQKCAALFGKVPNLAHGFSHAVLCRMLCLCAALGYAQGVDGCLQLGADIQTKDVMGRSPLHYAASRGQEECVAVLLLHNVSAYCPCDADELAMPAPQVAERSGHAGIAAALAEHLLSEFCVSILGEDLDSFKRRVADKQQRDNGPAALGILNMSRLKRPCSAVGNGLDGSAADLGAVRKFAAVGPSGLRMPADGGGCVGGGKGVNGTMAATDDSAEAVVMASAACANALKQAVVQRVQRALKKQNWHALRSQTNRGDSAAPPGNAASCADLSNGTANLGFTAQQHGGSTMQHAPGTPSPQQAMPNGVAKQQGASMDADFDELDAAFRDLDEEVALADLLNDEPHATKGIGQLAASALESMTGASAPSLYLDAAASDGATMPCSDTDALARAGAAPQPSVGFVERSESCSPAAVDKDGGAMANDGDALAGGILECAAKALVLTAQAITTEVDAAMESISLLLRSPLAWQQYVRVHRAVAAWRACTASQHTMAGRTNHTGTHDNDFNFGLAADTMSMSTPRHAGRQSASSQACNVADQSPLPLFNPPVPNTPIPQPPVANRGRALFNGFPDMPVQRLLRGNAPLVAQQAELAHLAGRPAVDNGVCDVRAARYGAYGNSPRPTAAYPDPFTSQSAVADAQLGLFGSRVAQVGGANALGQSMHPLFMDSSRMDGSAHANARAHVASTVTSGNAAPHAAWSRAAASHAALQRMDAPRHHTNASNASWTVTSC